MLRYLTTAAAYLPPIPRVDTPFPKTYTLPVHFNILLRWTRDIRVFFYAVVPIGVKVEYKSLESFPYYKDCAPLVEALGYFLVELRVVSQKQSVRISAVIASKNSAAEIGVDDCSKVQRALLPRLEALLGTDDTYMELTSPGMERTIKNAAEFAFFIGRNVRVWDKNVSDWRSGTITGADESSVRLKIDETEETFLFEHIAKAKFNNR